MIREDYIQFLPRFWGFVSEVVTKFSKKKKIISDQVTLYFKVELKYCNVFNLRYLFLFNLYTRTYILYNSNYDKKVLGYKMFNVRLERLISHYDFSFLLKRK